MNGLNQCRLVTATLPLIDEGFSHLRHKLPFIAGRMEDQLEDAECIAVSHFAPGLDGAELRMMCTTSPHNERADPADLVDSALCIQWRKPFIVMIMPGEHKIDSRSVELLPNCVHDFVVLVPTG